MMIRDPVSGLDIADPQQPLFAEPLPSVEEVRRGFETMILSASGWRKIFAADGEEESSSAEVGAVDLLLAAQAALSYADSLPEAGEERPLQIAVGCDTRPTGPVIADAVMRMLIASGLGVRPLFITAAPELLSYVQTCEQIDGFIYVTASHNPAGYNGLKFGYADGSVAGGELSRRLIASFRERVLRPEAAEEAAEWAKRVDAQEYAALLREAPRFKEEALQHYREFTRRVAAADDRRRDIERFFRLLSTEAEKLPVGIVADFNGSARTLSIDRRVLADLGIPMRSINEGPGEIAHRIVPEGESLLPCAELLKEARKEEPAYTLGYVPDNDGDRGNLVYYDTEGGDAAAIPAQQLFALTVLAELSWSTFAAESFGRSPAAVVVNGPTSMCIEEIARRFGAQVFRTEVGEANVVDRARQLRREGYTVRILGEGSNGGNITHPAAVRDPLNTLFSVLKLLLFRSGGEIPPLFCRWCALIGEPGRCRQGFTLTDILASLPPYRTTSAYEPEAKMQIRTGNHALLKGRYEEVFLRQWEQHRQQLAEEYGIVSWREINYEGSREIPGFGSGFRSGEERGGLKIVFSDSAGRDTDFIWMRGSGTEPVFRVMADSAGGDPQRERFLLDWQRQMISEADSGS